MTAGVGSLLKLPPYSASFDTGTGFWSFTERSWAGSLPLTSRAADYPIFWTLASQMRLLGLSTQAEAAVNEFTYVATPEFGRAGSLIQTPRCVMIGATSNTIRTMLEEVIEDYAAALAEKGVLAIRVSSNGGFGVPYTGFTEVEADVGGVFTVSTGYYTNPTPERFVGGEILVLYHEERTGDGHRYCYTEGTAGYPVTEVQDGDATILRAGIPRFGRYRQRHTYGALSFFGETANVDGELEAAFLEMNSKVGLPDNYRAQRITSTFSSEGEVELKSIAAQEIRDFFGLS